MREQWEIGCHFVSLFPHFVFSVSFIVNQLQRLFSLVGLGVTTAFAGRQVQQSNIKTIQKHFY